MKMRRPVVWILILAMVFCLYACGDDGSKKDTDRAAEDSLTGKYWLYSMTLDGEEVGYETLKLLGSTDSFLLLNGDGTAVISLVGEDPETLEYNGKDKILSDDKGGSMGFTVDGEKLTLDVDGSRMVFVMDGSRLLDQTEDPSAGETDTDVGMGQDGVTGQYWLYSMVSGGEEMDYELLCLFGMDDAYLRLNGDGTAQLSLMGEKPVDLEYDRQSMTIFDDDGDSMDLILDGQTITLVYPDSEERMVFVRDGSDLLDRGDPD